MSDGIGYEGTEEYVPLGADPYGVQPESLRVVGTDGKALSSSFPLAKPEFREFTISIDAPQSVVLPLFNYPAWVVTVNGQAAHAGSKLKTGQMTIPLGKGDNRVRATFTRTWDRWMGGLISCLSAILMLALYMRDRTDRGRSTCSPS